jgi:hypothetical protein
MPVDGEALRTALAKTATDHGPGLYGLVTEAGRPVFTGAGLTLRAPQNNPTRNANACDDFARRS